MEYSWKWKNIKINRIGTIPNRHNFCMSLYLFPDFDDFWINPFESFTVRRNFSGGSEVHQGRACDGSRRERCPEVWAHPRKPEKFSKYLKNPIKIYNLMKNFKEILWSFQFLKIFYRFTQKVGKHFKNYRYAFMAVRRAGGGGPPRLVNLLKS